MGRVMLSLAAKTTNFFFVPADVIGCVSRSFKSTSMYGLLALALVSVRVTG
jgi:hypothetical protein